MKLDLNPHKLFCVNEKKYVIVAKTGAIYEVDDATATLISLDGISMDQVAHEMNLKYGMTRDDVQRTIDEFRGVYLSGCHNDDDSFTYSLEQLRGIELMVCQCCNLACTYCYASEGEYKNPGWMSEQVGKKAIDFLFSHSTSKSPSISFFGGEPLLNYSLIKILVEYARKVAKEHEKTVSFAITTNGTLINDEIGNFLSQNAFYVSLSIDGSRDNHNTCRLNKAGLGSYDDSIRAIHTLDKCPITLRATSTPENCNYTEIANALFALNESEFFIAEAMNCFCSETALQKVEQAYDGLLNQFEKDLNLDEIRKCKANLLVYNNLKRIANFEKRSCSCSAFIGAVAVDIDGKVYPCHRFVGTTYCIGNIAIDDFDFRSAQELVTKDFLTKNRVGCSNCWAQNLCLGGCSYLNWEANGRCYIPSADKCKLNLHLLEKIVFLYLKLTEEQKDRLRL